MAELSWVFVKDSCHFVDVMVQFGPASVLGSTTLCWDRDEAVNSCNMHTLVHIENESDAGHSYACSDIFSQCHSTFSLLVVWACLLQGAEPESLCLLV